MSRDSRVEIRAIGRWIPENRMLTEWNFQEPDCDCDCHLLSRNDPFVTIQSYVPGWVWPGIITEKKPEPDPICGCNHAWSLDELISITKTGEVPV